MRDSLIDLEARLGHKESVKYLAQLSGYIEVPPTFDVFCESPYYCGKFFGSGRLWPIWKGTLMGIFPHPLYSPYREAIFTGSIGSGKSTASVAGLLYDLCKMLYLKNPFVTFGLMEVKEIVIAFMNANLANAKRTTWEQFQTIVRGSPFFQEQMLKARQPGKRDSQKIIFPNRIIAITGSRPDHPMGQDVCMAILSELNFMGKYMKDQAVENYSHIKRRMVSRFDRGDRLGPPGRLWMDSSRKDESGFLEQYMRDVTGSDTTLVASTTLWDCRESGNAAEYSGDRFAVFAGDAKADPKFLDGRWEIRSRGKEFPVFLGNNPSEARLLDTSPGAYYGYAEEKIIMVPMEFEKDFRFDLIGSLRDYAGVATWSGHTYIPNEAIVRASAALRSPVQQDIVKIDPYNLEDQLIKHIDLSMLPKGIPYFLHYDLAKGQAGGDRIGVAMTRCIGEINVDRAGFHKNQGNHLVRDMLYQTNLAIAVVGKDGREVPLSRMRNFFVHLAEEGYQIAAVSADGNQSQDLLATAREASLVGELQSVDIKRDAYDHFRDALLENRWTGPRNNLLINEILKLQDNVKKIDHPVSTGMQGEKPSKDIADCVAGSIYVCFKKSGGTKALQSMVEYSKAMEKTQREIGVREQLKVFGMNKKKRLGQ